MQKKKKNVHGCTESKDKSLKTSHHQILDINNEYLQNYNLWKSFLTLTAAAAAVHCGPTATRGRYKAD